MERFTELVFGNRFFEIPALDALSYIAAFLMIGAIIVSLGRRLMGTATQPEAVEFGEASYPEEWRKAA
jgi:hypothetical protein